MTKQQAAVKILNHFKKASDGNQTPPAKHHQPSDKTQRNPTFSGQALSPKEARLQLIKKISQRLK